MMLDLSGIIDLHVHTAPDLVARTDTDISLGQAARAAGMRAVVLKSHWSPTTARAQIASQFVPGIEVYGSLVLNWPVGGLNPQAVDAAIRSGAKVIWLPTLSAENQLRKDPAIGVHAATASTYRSSRAVLTILDDRDRPKDEVVEILDLVAASDVILATGHLDPREIELIVVAARQRGVRKVIVSHPEHPVVNLSVDDQRRLLKFGALFERCYAMTLLPNSNVTCQDIAAQIRAVGASSTILSTDLGAQEFVAPVPGMKRYLDELSGVGVSDAELAWMAQELPAQLLGM